MSTIKWLNYLLVLETILGVYRKYCSQRKITRYFITFQICFQSVCYSIIITIKLYLLLEGDVVLDQVSVIYCAFSASAYLNSLSSVVAGICYSREFMSYYRSISRLSDWFKNDIKLTKSLKKIYWSTIFFTLLFIAFVMIRSLEVLKKFPDMNKFLVVIIFGVQIIIRITIVYQQIMFFVVIMIVVNLIKSLNSLISAVQERVGSYDISSDEQYDITREQIQEWVELYQDLGNCCAKVTLCFGRQYFFSLVLVIPNYILMIYQICYQVGLNKEIYTDVLKKVIIAVFAYTLLTFLPFVAGQLARNQGTKLHRVLARLYNTLIITDSNDAEVKLIKGFIILVKKIPIEIKLLSKIPAGMYILPVILTLAVNYAIVLLQFNHVI